MRNFLIAGATLMSMIAFTDCGNTKSSTSNGDSDTVVIATAGPDSTAISDINCDTILDDSVTINIIPDEYVDFYITPVMKAGRHVFGYAGDISRWGGWYLDNTLVGDDYMLRYDSVGPSSLKFDLVTRQVTVDLRSPSSAQKLKRFMRPIDGFKRFHRKQTVCVDSADTEEYGKIRTIGEFSLVADYIDGNEKSDMINQYVCKLACESGIAKMRVPSLSSLSSSQKVADRMSGLSDYILKKTIRVWQGPDGPTFIGSAALDIGVRAHIINPVYVTFAVSSYDRAGIGHGGITENFHTLDLNTGKDLRNKDIFLPNSLEKVQQLLYETIARDPRYSETHREGITGDDILSMRESWDDGEPLPEGALTTTGVVFSFQPYEIDSWAAGTYHFILPYEQLMPYLSSETRSLISATI